jgi:hypothetical protein
VLGQLKKSQQNRATALGSCQITGIFFVGPGARGVFRVSSSGVLLYLLPSSGRINLGFSSERTQGQLLIKPLVEERRAEPCRQTIHGALFVQIRAVRASLLIAFQKLR